jgi:hypothetical protein
MKMLTKNIPQFFFCFAFELSLETELWGGVNKKCIRKKVDVLLEECGGSYGLDTQ